jgi:hypothetical protein
MGTYDFVFDPNFKGQLDEVRIWNVARTQADIQADMYREIPGTSPGLVGYWKFDEGSGSTANDYSPNNNDGTLLGGVAWVVSSSPLVNWLYVDTTSGSVPAGDSMIVEVTFDATGLNGGDYYADITIASNDPDEPEVTVPAYLHVIGAPDIVVSEDTLDYESVFVGASVTDTLIVSNEGTDLLTVSDISSDNSDYTVDVTNFTLDPDETQAVAVTFTPSTMGTITGILTITSDDPDETTVTVVLLGECLEPPDISVSPDSLSDTLNQGETSNHWLTIYNTGVSDLIFGISIEGTGVLSNIVTLAGEEFKSETPTELSGKPYSADRPASRGKINPGEIKLGTKMSVDLKILILESNGDASEMQSLLLSFPDISVVDIFDAYLATPSLATLLAYDCVITANHYPFYNAAGLGNVLADYVDAGGGVVVTVPSFASGYAIRGRLLDGGYMPFNIGSGTSIGPLNLGSFNASHPIMGGVTAAWGDALVDMTIATGAELVAEWNNGVPFVATKDSSVAGVNIYFGNPGYWTGDIPLLLHNAAFWTLGGVSWLSCDTTSGFIPAGDSVKIEVTFNATGLNIGDYYADIVITSNDPDESEVRVPAHLRVTGAGVEEKEILFLKIILTPSIGKQ